MLFPDFPWIPWMVNGNLKEIAKLPEIPGLGQNQSEKDSVLAGDDDGKVDDDGDVVMNALNENDIASMEISGNENDGNDVPHVVAGVSDVGGAVGAGPGGASTAATTAGTAAATAGTAAATAPGSGPATGPADVGTGDGLPPPPPCKKRRLVCVFFQV